MIAPAISLTRHHYVSTLTIPYIPYKSYKASKTNSSDMYQEFLLHAGLMGVDRFLMWNTHAVGNDNADASRSFDELQAMLDYGDEAGERAWSDPGGEANWTAGFMLTATALGDEGDPHCVWRFTPDLTAGGTVASQIKAGDRGLTLSGAVTLPKAQVFDLKTKRAPASTAGIWIKQTIPKGSSKCPRSAATLAAERIKSDDSSATLFHDKWSSSLCGPGDACWPSATQWAALNASLGGLLAAPGSAGYGKATVMLSYNDNFRGLGSEGCSANASNLPAFAVLASSEAHIQTAMKFAAAARVQVSIKNSGHTW